MSVEFTQQRKRDIQQYVRGGGVEERYDISTLKGGGGGRGGGEEETENSKRNSVWEKSGAIY